MRKIIVYIAIDEFIIHVIPTFIGESIPSVETMRMGRFNWGRLSVRLGPHPSPLPREREPETVDRPLLCSVAGPTAPLSAPC